jgi:MPBQ/MSBQ methyltransferase
MTMVKEDALAGAVAAHYGKAGLTDAIFDGLRKAGADPQALTPDDLAPVDEFHTAGRRATVKAAAMMPLAPGMHVLDAGCGIGGAARYLASEHGCRVTGIDLTPDYIETARALTARTGLSEACAFQVGSVLDMPFDGGVFDAAISFHVAMNIADRRTFYSELARVLRPGAALCIFDVMKGPAPGMLYPVPWAETEATSFLKSNEETRALLGEAGFQITAEDNLREFAIGYFREIFAKAAKMNGPPPLGLHLLTGENSATKFANYVEALNTHQIEPLIVVATRQ